LLDEHIWQGLAPALRERGFDVVHVNEIERAGLDDEEQLAYAAGEGRAILTFNARHFEPLAAKWSLESKEHSGIIISDQMPVGDPLRRSAHLFAARSAEDLDNIITWLQDYK
jgi:hypothetical protein